MESPLSSKRSRTPLLDQLRRKDIESGVRYEAQTWREELSSAILWRAMLAELLGSFSFFLLGIGVDIIYRSDPLFSAATWGLSLIGLVYTFEEISGAHFNPATSFATWLIREISFIRLLMFTIAQFLGAILATAFLRGLFSDDIRQDRYVHLGVTDIFHGSPFNGFVLEVIMTFLFIYVDFSVTLHPIQGKIVKKIAPLAIGATLASIIIFGITITGASINPARSFAPALLSGYWAHHWVYWVGPYVGAVAAAIFYSAFLKGNNNKRDDFLATEESERIH